MITRWRAVTPSRGVVETPPLLLRATRQETGFTIELTDLAYLWAETLSYDEILKRANELETEIDPSEDSSQYEIFIQKVTSALEGAPRTSIALYKSRDILVIHTTTYLPEPLNPLRWQGNLAKCSQSHFYTEFQYPLLESHYALQNEVSSLLHHMKEKDTVIQKIVDGLATAQVDLGQIFPSLGRGGKGLKGREVAGTVIRGMASFDEIVWRKDMETRVFSPYGPEFVKSVVSREHIASSKGPQRSLSEWWHKLPSANSSSQSASKASLTSYGVPSEMKTSTLKQSSTEDFFEVCAHYLVKLMT
jgi:hypothetical protein